MVYFLIFSFFFIFIIVSPSFASYDVAFRDSKLHAFSLGEKREKIIPGRKVGGGERGMMLTIPAHERPNSMEKEKKSDEEDAEVEQDFDFHGRRSSKSEAITQSPSSSGLANPSKQQRTMVINALGLRRRAREQQTGGFGIHDADGVAIVIALDVDVVGDVRR